MRVTIKGLTDSTITFNTIGIILRGNSAKVNLYPNSIAKHIDIKNDAQMTELITLKNAKLIEVIDEDIVQQQPITTQKIATPPPKGVKDTKVIKPPTPAISASVPILDLDPNLDGTTILKTEDIEDMPSTQSIQLAENEELLTINSKKKPHRKTGKPRGRPKKGKSIKAAKVTKPSKTSSVKPVKKAQNFIVSAEPTQDEEPDSKIVVMTPGGAVTGEAVNNMAGDMPESEATKASIEALKKMEEEEAMPDTPVDESKLDISQKMGGEAVIATGESSFKKVGMKNSLVPDADAIKNRGIKFIDPNGDGSVEEDSDLDESIKDIFIDNEDNTGDEDNDHFIET